MKSENVKKIALTKDPSGRIRSEAVDALGYSEDKEVIHDLIELLNNDPDWRVRCSAAEALCRLGVKLGGAKEAIEPLIASLKDKDSLSSINLAYVRYCAADALGELGAKEAIEPLIALLKDKDDRVRGISAEALGKLGAKKAVKPLIDFLTNALTNARDRSARLYAIWSLGKIGDKEAVKPLIDLTKDRDRGDLIRIKAIQALIQLNAKEAIPNLRELLNEVKSEMRFYWQKEWELKS